MGKKRLILAFLLSGCTQPSGNYCDISSTLWFDSNQTIDYLAENDENLLRDIVIHNETRKKLCD